MKLTDTVFALYAPSLTLALVQSSWDFKRFPRDGLDDITFPINMAYAPHEEGFYFAQKFNFKGVKQVGYTDIQLRDDSDGNSVVHGVFSSFQGGTTSAHPNCHGGADGGPDISCSVDIDGDYSHTYNFVAENTGERTWQGSMVDTETGSSTVIGEWTLPPGAGKLENGQEGFMEYYLWNDTPTHTCTSLPKTEATYGDPTSRTPGAAGGKVKNFRETGDCIGEVGYSMKKSALGVTVNVELSGAAGRLRTIHTCNESPK